LVCRRTEQSLDPKGLPENVREQFFQNAFDRLVSARERQVRRYVNGALLAMDDASSRNSAAPAKNFKREGAQAYLF
jgi:hypothetical protein